MSPSRRIGGNVGGSRVQVSNEDIKNFHRTKNIDKYILLKRAVYLSMSF